MILKKGAMFGLDARIALAIFGALTVISGAALYSAIQESKVVKTVYNFKEVCKAWESYYLDTGVSLPILSLDPNSEYFYRYNIGALVEDNGVLGWDGPYISYKKIESFYLNYGQDGFGGFLLLVIKNEDGWGDSIDWAKEYCIAGKDCAVWLHVDNGNLSLLDAIDTKVDGFVSRSSGAFRTQIKGNTNGGFYKCAPIKNPLD